MRPIEGGRAHHDRSDRIGVRLRRGAMCLLAAVVVVALTNTVGQRAGTAHAVAAQAQLDVRAPTAVRPGLLFQAKITVTAHASLPKTQLVLSSGWADGLTLNTAEPSPSTQQSGPQGSLVFNLGTLQPGQAWVEYLEYQVNPTSISRRTQVVTVLSNAVPVVTVRRTMTIVP
ncbi:MAG TPA: hypothetical protein VG650_00690 [Mycobacteriales bacterium]|nr:hypothetical protein [Mycobacteriales bacterium]